MKLRVIGSSSNGNSYALIANDGEILAIEAGCKMADFKKAIDFQISKVVGCILSHEHLDHAKYIGSFIRAGIPVYTAYETHTALETITGELTTTIEPLKRLKIGSFTVTPFNVPHDAEIECYGYLVEHEDMGKLLFLTDLMYCKYNFSKQKINHIMVESNYSIENVNRDAENSTHILRGHMAIETAIELIKTNDNPSLLNVVLIHLSQTNADSADFIHRVKNVTDKNVYVARKGLEVCLGLYPF